jgi:hypothetical protein
VATEHRHDAALASCSGSDGRYDLAEIVRNEDIGKRAKKRPE